MATSRQTSEFATHAVPAVSCECSRSTVDPDEPNVMLAPWRRAPEPNTTSVSSNPARRDSPSHTASQNQDRKSVEQGKSVDPAGRGIIKKKRTGAADLDLSCRLVRILVRE